MTAFDTHPLALSDPDAIADASLLGGMLADSACLHVALATLADDDLATPDGRATIRVMRHLTKRRKSLDLPTLSVTASTLRLKFETPLWLRIVEEHTVAKSNFGFHHQQAVERVARRKLSTLGRAILADAADDGIDPATVITTASQGLRDAAGSCGKGTSHSMVDCLVEAQADLANKERKSVIETGISGFDYGFRGLPANGLIYLGARPGVGKTAIAMQIAVNVAAQGTPVRVYGMERDRVDMTHLIVCQQTAIPIGRFDPSTMWRSEEVELLASAQKKLRDLPLTLADDLRVHPGRLLADLHALPDEERPKLLVVDYLQLMDTSPVQRKGTSREQEVAWLSRELKAISMEFRMSVLVLAQLNREVASRGSDAKPRLSDLRESGSLEQDGDMILLLHRPGATVVDDDAPPTNDALLIVAKNRRGRIGTVPLEFDGPAQRFIDPATRF